MQNNYQEEQVKQKKKYGRDITKMVVDGKIDPANDIETIKNVNLQIN